jgi:hypothetical protein
MTVAARKAKATAASVQSRSGASLSRLIVTSDETRILR